MLFDTSDDTARYCLGGVNYIIGDLVVMIIVTIDLKPISVINDSSLSFCECQWKTFV